MRDAVRSITFRLEAIRNGVSLCEILAADAPAIQMQSSGEIKTAITGAVITPPEVDWHTDRLRPYMTLDGVETQLGEYIISTEERTTDRGVTLSQIEGYDLGLLAKQTALESRLYIPAGTLYLQIIKELLSTCGITRIVADENQAAIATDREDWEIGTSYLAIINDLLKEVNYNSLWFDLAGNARLERYKPPTAANITRTYASGEASIIGDPISKSVDTFDACNVFVATVSNPEFGDMMASAVNDNPTSPTCIQRIGRRMAQVERLDNIASQEDLQAYVDNLAVKSMVGTETVSFWTAITPHTVHEVVAINHPYYSGIVEETEWSITLKAGEQMTHKGKRVLYQ